MFGKVVDSGATKKKTDVLVAKLKAMLPKRLDHGSKGAKLNYDPIKAKDVYREISLGGSFPVQFVAVLTAAMQNAGIDFYTDSQCKSIYINRDHCSAAHLGPLKQFISSRLRFIINRDFGKEDAVEKKLQKLAELVHQQAAFTIDTQDSFRDLIEASKKISAFMEQFSGVFNKD